VRRRVGALFVLVLVGCSPTPRPPPPSPALPAAAAAAGPCYRLDATHSELRILAYRSGPLARLGHNHVILAGELDGELCGGHFTLSFPVAALVVDPPAARAEEGEDFASVPTRADVDGTRRHLLGPGQLEADAWPRIRLAGAFVPRPGHATVAVRIGIRDATSEIAVPVDVSVDADGRLVAIGGVEFAQSSFGLVPFSVAMGALKVRDDIAIRFRLVADATLPAATEAPRKPIDPRS
jgi:hypothetical protein